MKKGMTLIEIIISLALFTIVLTSIATIFSSTIINIGDNGESINNINEAMAELNIALTTPTYEGMNNTVTQSIKTVDVNGTAVPIRHIVSQIVDQSGKGTNKTIDIEAFVMPELSNSNPTGVFVDFDGNEKFDQTDRAVTQDEINRGFTYLGNGDLIVSSGSNIDVTRNFDIKVKDNIILKRNVNIVSGGEINIECNEFLPASGVSIIANDDINLNAKILKLINGIHIKSIDGNVNFRSNEIYVNGLKSDSGDISTIISAKNEVLFDIDENGIICLGTKGEREPDNSLFFFEIDGAEGYALNKNMTLFSEEYEYPHYKDEDIKDYFKQYK